MLKIPFNVCVHFHEEGIELTPSKPQHVATVSLSGTPTALLRFAKTHAHTQMLMDKEIKIVGDLELLMEIKRIQERLMIDWQGLLAEYVGDFAANRLNLMARKAREKLSYHLKLARKDTLDYIHHEAQLLPTQAEAEQFYEEVRTLRHEIERLERKIKND